MFDPEKVDRYNCELSMDSSGDYDADMTLYADGLWTRSKNYDQLLALYHAIVEQSRTQRAVIIRQIESSEQSKRSEPLQSPPADTEWRLTGIPEPPKPVRKQETWKEILERQGYKPCLMPTLERIQEAQRSTIDAVTR